MHVDDATLRWLIACLAGLVTTVVAMAWRLSRLARKVEDLEAGDADRWDKALTDDHRALDAERQLPSYYDGARRTPIITERPMHPHPEPNRYR